MNLQSYQEKKRRLSETRAPHRRLCLRCRKATVTCYCHFITPFESSPQFVLLMHPHEVKRSIATGRMTHLSISNSRLYEGLNFTDHAAINEIIGDPQFFPVLLFPDAASQNLSQMTRDERHLICPNGKSLIVVVLDGTWDQARSIKFQSKNLQNLPRICFTPPRPSQFLIRKQPAANCYSTIEAVHHLIELLGADSQNESQNLLHTFSKMVQQQIDYAANNLALHGPRSTRGIRNNG